MNGFDLTSASNIYIGGAQASAVYLGSTKIWPRTYERRYFTIHNRSQSNIAYVCYNNTEGNSQGYYSLDDGDTWNAFPAYTSNWKYDTSVQLPPDSDILIKDTRSTYVQYAYPRIHCTQSYIASGNTMSLLYGDNFIGQTALPFTYAFANLFNNETNLSHADNLILPANTLTTACYWAMFKGCTGLLYGPDLNAMTLASSCYAEMFSGCTSLKSYRLPALNLASSCYQYMFADATSFRRLYFYAMDVSPSYCVNHMLENNWPYAGACDFHMQYYATYDPTTFVPTSEWTIIRDLGI